MKKALITGITGQGGAYLAEFLLKKGYEGALEFDATKPDGTPRKLMDSTKINNLGWKASIKLNDGISKTIEEVMHQF